MLKKILLLIFSLHATLLISQTNDFNNFIKKYELFFELDQETIFTQVNKSKFLNTEQLWFKSYIYNIKTQLPYNSTTNIYAEIFNEKGQLVSKKLYYADNGMTYGNFALTKEFTPGIYYLKVTTNWMKNFDNDGHSLHEFEILGLPEEKSVINTERLYDLQLLPEGGNLLNDVTNTIGFKILNYQGQGVKISSGKILDSNNATVSTFTSNHLGMGKFNVFVDAKNPLNVVVILEDGSEISQKIVNPHIQGISISTNVLNTDKIFINIKTNSATIKQLLGKQFYLVIHRDGLLKKIDFNFEENKFDYIISVPKADLFNGVNILTLFNDENKPLAERVIFNQSNKLIEKTEVLGHTIGKDSTTIRLLSSVRDSVSRNISISVLPSSTKSYDNVTNIQSAFLLQPYVTGTIERPEYYFKNQDRKTTYDLDLLLLNQGWSSYSWNTIFTSPPKPYFNFESGIEIKGKINSKDVKKDAQALLVSPENELIVTEIIDANNNFNFSNLFLLDSTSISISVQNKDQKLSYSGLYYNIYPNEFNDNINLKGISKNRKKTQSYFPEDFKLIYDNLVTLDTVSIQTTVKKPKNSPVHSSFAPKLVDLESTYLPTSLVLEIIRQNGFDVRQQIDNIQIISRSKGTFSGTVSPTVYLDNVPLNGYLTDLQYMTAQDIEELYISTSPSVNSLGGNIHIFTKKTYKSKSAPSNFNISMIKNGFSKPQKYSSPMYNKTEHTLFSDYGVLHWIPNLKMNDSGEFVFKIPNYLYENINLYIEGMGSDGSLMSKIETLKLNRQTN